MKKIPGAGKKRTSSATLVLAPKNFHNTEPMMLTDPSFTVLISLLKCISVNNLKLIKLSFDITVHLRDF